MPSANAVSQQKYVVILDCDHSNIYRGSCPKRGETVFCRSCDDYTTVSVISKQWEAKCDECRYTSRKGVTKVVARRNGKDHAEQNAHVVFIRLNGETTEVLRPKAGRSKGKPVTQGEHIASLNSLRQDYIRILN